MRQKYVQRVRSFFVAAAAARAHAGRRVKSSQDDPRPKEANRIDELSPPREEDKGILDRGMLGWLKEHSHKAFTRRLK